jgi:hypothetical protein
MTDDEVGYPEIKADSHENQIFASVYYGPDYYQNMGESKDSTDDPVYFDLDYSKDKDEEEDLMESEKKRGLQKIKGWLSRKGNKL